MRSILLVCPLLAGTAVAGRPPFTATPGHFYNFRLSAIKNELHAYVDGVFVGGALDNSIRRGNYGVDSYRTAFTYGKFTAEQP